ncbi:hypothetical protein [Paracoccus sp. 22332]|uniref:hypothetical protein n=1 Tax=Paracoccus sp. 22332 TaxID=3453913 RepID=UPI003F8354F0
MDPRIIIEKIERLAAETGLKTSTICQGAFSNPFYLERLERRLERLGDEIERFERFEAEERAKRAAKQEGAA